MYNYGSAVPTCDDYLNEHEGVNPPVAHLQEEDTPFSRQLRAQDLVEIVD